MTISYLFCAGIVLTIYINHNATYKHPSRHLFLQNNNNFIDEYIQPHRTHRSDQVFSPTCRQYETHRRKVESIMTKSTHSLSFRKADQFGSFHSSKDKANRYTLKSTLLFTQWSSKLLIEKTTSFYARSSMSIADTVTPWLAHGGTSPTIIFQISNASSNRPTRKTKNWPIS